MQAAIVRDIGTAPEVGVMPMPSRPAGHCLVRIEAAALQPVELFIASGRFYDGPPQLPYVPGLEGVGTVVESDELSPGTRVRVEVVHPGYGQQGCFAEYVLIPEGATAPSRASRSRVSPARTDLSAELIAAAGSSGASAKLLIERAIAESGPLAGKHVVVLGATGVVGEFLVQLCRQAGVARVVAVGRSRARLDHASNLGAAATVRLGEDDNAATTAAILAASEGQVDVIFDPLWGEPAAAALDAASTGAVLINFGQSAGPRSLMSGVPLRARGVRIIGHSGARTSAEELHRATEEILDDIAAGTVTISHEPTPLSQLPSAWQRQSESPGTKLVVIPGA
ncbi:MAG: quinone oxidoreductase family protein [Solirubrobacterales bacterium]